MGTSNKTALSNKTVANFNEDAVKGLKRNIQKFGCALERGISDWITEMNDGDQITRAFQTTRDSAMFKEERVRLYYQTLRTAIDRANRRELEKQIEEIVAGGHFFESQTFINQFKMPSAKR